MRALALLVLAMLTAAPAAAQQQPIVRAPALRPPVVQAPPAETASRAEPRDTRDAISQMGAEDQHWIEHFMRLKGEREAAISDAMTEASESEDTITPNMKDE